jgi:hypothetical protein
VSTNTDMFDEALQGLIRDMRATVRLDRVQIIGVLELNAARLLQEALSLEPIEQTPRDDETED